MPWLLLALFVLTGCSSSPSKNSALASMQIISGTEHHLIESTHLDRSLNLLVRLPEGYDPETRYPTIYLLDGGNLYPMLGAYYQYLRHQEAASDLIIVGISYGASTFPEGNYRSTDFTAPSPERSFWGGAETFQQAMTEEILPLVESRYASDPSQRILFGQSLGGQFVLFNALTKPDLFYGHIASNLAIHRNLDYFLARPFRGETKLFVSGGENDTEQFKTPRETWLTVQSPHPDFKVVEMPDQGHFSIVPESFRQGLEWLFNNR